ncbi:hypothetical protein MMC28_005786 [Mycoblastus sanguinarius]|nr:hypothetical protein [Mycoblastus sanguinarius]
MSTDYTKKKNAELEELLKSRSLPHTGKKADLVARLQQYDAEQAQAQTTKAPAAAGAEDEIDWEDDAAAATDPAGAAAIAAGGLTQPANPTAVPNQKIDIDPSKTDDLTVDPPTDSTVTNSDAKPTTTTTTDTAKATEPADSEAPKPNFASGVASTTLDSELAKRQKRAARFGIQESDSDALKALERAKKFGTGDAGDKSAVRGLDEALPERMARGQKRGRGRDEAATGGGGGGKRSRVRGGREGRQRREGSGTPGKRTEGGASGLGEKDRLAAEARKKKFAAMA